MLKQLLNNPRKTQFLPLISDSVENIKKHNGYANRNDNNKDNGNNGKGRSNNST
jgi:hypothetical protein